MTNENSAATAASQRLIREHQSAQKRRYAKGVALIILAVLAGMVIGAGGTLLYFKNKMHRIPPKPDAIADAMMKHLRGLITVNPDEEARVREIFDAHLVEVDAMRKESFQNIREMFRKMDGEVEAVIGPERAKIWREDKEKRFKRRRDERRHPDDKKGPPPR